MAGVTGHVPPAAARVLLVPSDPEIVTVVALVAATVNVDDAPAAMVVELAEIVTVGDVVPAPTVPHPVITRSNDKVIARGIRIVRSGRETRSFITMLWSFLLCHASEEGSNTIAKTTVMQKRENWQGATVLY